MLPVLPTRDCGEGVRWANVGGREMIWRAKRAKINFPIRTRPDEASQLMDGAAMTSPDGEIPYSGYQTRTGKPRVGVAFLFKLCPWVYMGELKT
jgi:hypothetical protein